MKIFLSYRRADSQATAGRMAQFLDAVSAVKQVFLDVDDIEIGEDYELKIRRALAEASHAFVLIGSAWRGPEAAAAHSRILADNDVVRLEVRTALASRVRLVPILIDEARMPAAHELPEDLRSLAKINAFSLRSAHFERDMDDLLESLLGRGRASRWRKARLTPAAIALRALGGVAAGIVLLLTAALANRHAFDGCYDLVCRLRLSFGIASDGEALGLLWLIAAVVLVLAALLPFVPRWLSRRRSG